MIGDVINSNKLNEAEEISKEIASEVKYIKKDKGLIERTENDKKVILMEDNRQVLFG